MGRSKNRKRRGTLTTVAPSYRSVPYSRVSKKNFRRFAPISGAEYRRGNTRKVVNNGVRLPRKVLKVFNSVPRRALQKSESLSSMVSRLSGTVVLSPESQTRRVRKVRTVCERRSVREQVMHALNKTGLVGQKTPRWTKESRKKCK